MAEVKITISVDGENLNYEATKDGQPHAPGSCVHAVRKDDIEWDCSSPFRIHFGDRTPFSKRSFSSRGPRRGKVRDEASFGRYKYSVAVAAGGGPPLLDDPEVCIDPE